MDTMTWLTLVLALTAVASAVFAFVQAKAATDSRREADEARDEARAARDKSLQFAAEANAALRRQADAQETANEISKETLRSKGVLWEFARDGIHGVLKNVGDLPALDAVLTDASGHPGLVLPDHHAAGTVHPNESLGFYFQKISALETKVKVSWTDVETLQEQSTERIVR